MFLAGDVGGTKSLLALATKNKILIEERIASAEYSNFYSLLKDFLKKHPSRIDGVALGVAGIVKGESAKITNLPWTISKKALQKITHAKKIVLINDFEAAGYGLGSLKPKDVAVINRASPEQHGTRVVIGPGTGLGEALLVWSGKDYIVVPSEGGHENFAAQSEEEWELRAFIAAETGLGFVDWESVLSGQGLVRIYNFLRKKTYALESAVVAQEIQTRDPAAVISSHGLKKDDRLCGLALGWFARFLGAEAGNLALKAKATGGVYIAGGIAPKIIPALRTKNFRCAFTEKGKMLELLKRVPVFVVKNERVGLLGLLNILSKS